jgi:hypothetical protein
MRRRLGRRDTNASERQQPRAGAHRDFSFVASAAAIHPLPLPETADLNEKSDLGATARVAQLVTRAQSSMERSFGPAQSWEDAAPWR